MNAYDFDKTIYDGDSTRDFFLYCIRRNPSLLRYLPMQGWHALLWKGFHVHSKTEFKENFYRFFKGISDIDRYVDDFWAGHFKNIKSWYLAKKRPDDLIISASPEFLLTPAIKKLGLSHLIASRVDRKTGAYTGENCWGEEKVNRLKAQMPNAQIEDFYSDSLSDTPMAELATGHKWIVRGNRLIEWETYRSSKKRHI